jgi:hypothetical protein
MPERTMLFLSKLELLNAAASLAMVAAMVVMCLLLTRQYERLGVMEQELVLRNEQGQRGLSLADERNVQGARQLELLEEAVRRLDR